MSVYSVDFFCKNFWPLLDEKKMLFLLNFRVIELIFVWPYLWWLNCILNDFFQILFQLLTTLFTSRSLPSYHYFCFVWKLTEKTNFKLMKSNCWKERVRKIKKCETDKKNENKIVFMTRTHMFENVIRMSIYGLVGVPSFYSCILSLTIKQWRRVFF